jgi:predicted DNA-binding transcriptional regulator AlpA
VRSGETEKSGLVLDETGCQLFYRSYPINTNPMETIIITSETEIKKWIRDILREELAGLTPATQPSTPPYDEPLLTRKEIAGYLKISLVTLHDWMNKGLPHIKQGGRVFFLKSEVLAVLKDRPAKRR